MFEFTNLVLRISPFPLPDTTAIDSARLAMYEEKILPLWEAYLKPHAPTKAEPSDFEHFVEQVARLHAALQYYAPEQIWLYWGGHPARNLASGDTETKEKLLAEGAKEYGVIHRNDLSESRVSYQNRLASAYATYETFVRHAKRRMSLATFAPDHDSDTDMIEALQNLRALGVDRAFVKTAFTKYASSFVELESDDYETLKDAVFEAFDWALIHFEGKRDAFLVQEAIEMEYEYRFFVVANRLVTGAGCVEEYTPLNNTDCFDPNVRKFRMDPEDPVVTQPGIVQRYRDFAETVVRELCEEVPELEDYVLDVALTPKGPAVIELNGLANSGLYASDPSRVVEAITLA